MLSRDLQRSAWTKEQTVCRTRYGRIVNDQNKIQGVGYARHQSPLKEVIEMRTLPTMMIRLLEPFAPLFSKRVFQHVHVLVAGTILAPGRKTVSSALRAMGLDQHKRFHRYHRVLSRASWSAQEVIRNPVVYFEA